ncbi:hypothetical protein GCM10009119_22750 [Algoriphagus jejuensis]|uniref:Uncharacterized protein n=1 Tax=Algoriphagus jejuensis TaxID=419934 RepID=A0ABN1N0J4_9BACT
MKFPSLFRTTAPLRYDVKPRYYDPIKEEIEQRTSRIKRELTEEGLLDEEEVEIRSKSMGENLRGSFAQHRGIKTKSSSLFNSTAMIRTLLFFAMIIGAFGYIYLGPVIFEYMLYIAVAIGGLYYASRFLKRRRNDD